MEESKHELLEKVVSAIKEFDGWVPCQCSECALDARSHAVNETASMEGLIRQIENIANDNRNS